MSLASWRIVVADTPARALLASIVDYAGLFPPAKLPMEDVVVNYHRYAEGPFDWMLGRLIVPAARLDELEQSAADVLAHSNQSRPWELSVLVPGPEAETMLRSFEARLASGSAAFLGRVAALEVSTPDASSVAAAAALKSLAPVYAEVPVDDALPQRLEALRESGLHAKIRTGGVTPDAIPPVEAVANFLIECARRRLAFKATAGLHHPVRGSHALTYEPHSPQGVMHGFLGVFLAAAYLAVSDLDGDGIRATVMRLLQSESVHGFRLDRETVRLGDVELSAAALERARREFAHGFGSCSFEEPVEDLKEAGLL